MTTLITLEQLREETSSRWHRPQVQAYLRTLSANQMREDQALINLTLARAYRSETALSGLAWAHRHEVSVLVDHKLPPTQAAGVYVPGTGICLLPVSSIMSTGARKTYCDVWYLNHELRHARQDVAGLLPAWPWDKYIPEGNIIEAIKRNALLEGDCYVHDRVARYECHSDKVASLDLKRKYFIDYYRQKRGLYYYNVDINRHGAVLGLPWAKYPIYEISVGPTVPATPSPGVDPNNDADIDRLGESFDGSENYLSGWFDQAVRQVYHTDSAVRRTFNTKAAPDARIDEILAIQNKNRQTAATRTP